MVRRCASSGDLPTAVVDGDTVDDILMRSRGLPIDGQNGVLGRAGPTRLRSGSLLPIIGVMEFDIGDLARLEAEGGLLNVIVHEMGHVLGIGTIWQLKNLLVGVGVLLTPATEGQRAHSEQKSLREFGDQKWAQSLFLRSRSEGKKPSSRSKKSESR